MKFKKLIEAFKTPEKPEIDAMIDRKLSQDVIKNAVDFSIKDIYNITTFSDGPAEELIEDTIKQYGRENIIEILDKMRDHNLAVSDAVFNNKPMPPAFDKNLKLFKIILSLTDWFETLQLVITTELASILNRSILGYEIEDKINEKYLDKLFDYIV